MSPSVPSTLSKARLDLLVDFYRVSDQKEATEKYADFFTDDAIIIMGLNKFEKRAGIVGMRGSMWAAVSTRKHALLHVATFGDSDDDLMLQGTVEYGLPNTSKKVTCEWAARMQFTKAGKSTHYQVWLDSSPLLVAQGKTLDADEQGNLRIRKL